uniref:Uncharacterized protein n=1 Tax=Arundo donax TaxID=35708 RepID=A0A0A9F9A2_ARUDO
MIYGTPIQWIYSSSSCFEANLSLKSKQLSNMTKLQKCIQAHKDKYFTEKNYILKHNIVPYPLGNRIAYLPQAQWTYTGLF